MSNPAVPQEVREAMEQAERVLACAALWHRGDKWRHVGGEREREWEEQRDKIEAALSALRAVSTEEEQPPEPPERAR